MPTEKKRTIVADTVDKLSRSNAIILTNYRGLDVAGITAVRRSVEGAGGSYHVVKNTLLNLALAEAEIKDLQSYLEGPVAVAFGYGEVVALAKAIVDQMKEYPQLQIRAGWATGQVMDEQNIKALSALPSRPVLMGQVAGTIQAPMSNLVNGLATVLRQLIYALKQRSEGAAEAEERSEEAA